MKALTGQRVFYVLVVLFSLFLFAGPALAIDVSPGSGSGKPGDEVTIPICMSGNTQRIIGFGMTFNFDSSRLDYLGGSFTGPAASPPPTGPVFISPPGSSPVQVIWGRKASPMTDSGGCIVSLRFRIKSDACGDVRLFLTNLRGGFANATTSDGSLSVMRTACISGTIRSGGQGVGGINVQVSGTSSGSATTDSNGAYSVCNLNVPGTFTVTPMSDQYTFNRREPVPINDCRSVSGQDFTATPAPIIQLSPTTLPFRGVRGCQNPPSQTLTITNTGGGTLNWTATTNRSWLSVNPPSGTAPSQVAVSVNTSGLSQDDTGMITVSGVARNTPQTATVTLTVDPPPMIGFSPSSLSFSGSNPPPQTLTINNTGSGTLNWTATRTTESGNWLMINPTSGTAPSPITVSVNPTGLSAGTHRGKITINSTCAGNAPRDVSVTLATMPPSPPPSISSIRPNSGNPGQTVEVTILGSNFQQAINANFGDGIRVNSINPFVSPSEMRVNITILPTAAPGCRTVTVTNPDGLKGELPNGFCVSVRPTITNISPDAARLGQKLEVRIEGRNFKQVPMVDFGSDIQVNPPIRFVSESLLIANISIGNTTGFRTVKVTNPDGSSDSKPNAFNVVVFLPPQLPPPSSVQNPVNMEDDSIPKDVAVDPRTNLALLVLRGSLSSKITVINLDTNQRCVTREIGPQSERVAINPQTGVAVVTNSNDSVSIINLPGECSRAASDLHIGAPISLGSGSRPMGVAIHPQLNKAVVANSGNAKVSVIDLSNGSVTSTITVEPNPQSITIDPARSRAFVTHSGSNKVSVVDLKAMRVLPDAIVLQAVPTALAINEQTRQAIVVYGQRDMVSVIDLEGRELGQIPVGRNPVHAAINPQRNMALVVNNGDNTITEIDLTNLKSIGKPVPTSENPTAIALNPIANSGIVIYPALRTTGKDGEAGLRQVGFTNRYSGAGLPAVLDFPRFNPQGDERIGFTFVNTSGELAPYELRARNKRGEEITSPMANPKQDTLQEGKQFAQNGDELFNVREEGWVRATSPSSKLKGFFTFYDDALTYLDGVDTNVKPVREAILPAVDQTYTEITVVNPNDGPANVTLEFVDNDGNTMSRRTIDPPLPGFGMFNERMNLSTGYVRVTSDVAVRAYEQFGGADRAGLNGQSALPEQSVLIFPQWAVGIGFSTTVTVVNLESSPDTLMLTAYDANGRVSNPVSLPIAGHGKQAVSVADLFGLRVDGESRTGWIKVESVNQGGITGYVSYGIGPALAAVPVQLFPRTSLTFSHVAAGLGLFTGVALLNPNNVDVEVTLEVKKPDGARTGRITRLLRPNERVAMQLHEWLGVDRLEQVGGYVEVRSTLPIYGLELFGTLPDIRVLSAVPAQ